jgi:hypothetical protein
VVSTHIIEEKDIAQVVVLEGLPNYVSPHGEIEPDLLMVKRHFITVEKKLKLN